MELQYKNQLIIVETIGGICPEDAFFESGYYKDCETQVEDDVLDQLGIEYADILYDMWMDKQIEKADYLYDYLCDR